MDSTATGRSAADLPAPKNRIEQYLDFMICILRADGVVDPAERKHLLALMVGGMKLESSLVERYRGELERAAWSAPTDSELEEIGAGLDDGSLAHLVRDGYGLAASDGEIHRSELALIQRFLRVNGVPAERFEDIDRWARQSLALAHRGTVLFRR